MRLQQSVLAVGLVLGFGFMSQAAKASYVVTFMQSAAGVTAVGIGEINTDLLTEIGLGNVQLGINPSNGYFGFLPSPTSSVYGLLYTGNFTTGSAYGSGQYSPPSTTSGNLAAFGFTVQEVPEVSVPNGYVSGSPLSSTMTFAGATFASLGLAYGTFTYTYVQQEETEEQFRALAAAAQSYDTIQVVVSRSVPNVPLPASAPMFGAALMALGAVGYGLKRKKAAAA